MKKNARRIELRTADGKVILVLHLSEEMALEDNKKNLEDQTPSTEREERQSTKENPLMTSAQKRYLFRILAERGTEGDEAHEHLKSLFQVDSLKDVTKLEASKMIEQLLEEAKGDGDGPPF